MYRPDRRQFLKVSTIGASITLFGRPFIVNGEIKEPQTHEEREGIIKRRLGRTGLELPVVSMGVMRADNPGLVRAALKAGMVYLDTAHGYQKGKNEQMLGEVLKVYPRDSFVIGTKLPPDDTESFFEKLNISLQRLQMDYTDILYLHGVSSREDALNAEMLAALKKAKDSGTAHYVGLSTHKNEPEVLRAAAESGVYDVVLTAVNFKQDHYPEVKKAIAEAVAEGIGIIAMKTMAGGFLDRERKKPINCKAALKWVLQDERITSTIPGITSYEMLAENASVNRNITLTKEEKAELAIGMTEGGLYCQGCERCTRQCYKNLPIPEIMRAYMYTYGYRDSRQAQDLLLSLNLTNNPCADCTQCSAICAKNFAISERVADVMRLTTVPEEFIS